MEGLVAPISDRDLLGHNRCLMWTAYLEAIADHRPRDAEAIYNIWFRDSGTGFPGYAITKVQSGRGGRVHVELRPVDNS